MSFLGWDSVRALVIVHQRISYDWLNYGICISALLD
jgi:hypothetical protein